MSKYLKSKCNINENEIELDHEVLLFEYNIINAYISSANIDLNEKFGLKYEDDSYFDIYLNYNFSNKKIYLEIEKVTDEERIYYKYIPNNKEYNILKDKLEKYLIQLYNKNIEQFVKEQEEEFE